jgi:ABC-type Na+ transport system ATPase subunit NatA
MFAPSAAMHKHTGRATARRSITGLLTGQRGVKRLDNRTVQRERKTRRRIVVLEEQNGRIDDVYSNNQIAIKTGPACCGQGAGREHPQWCQV